MSIVQLDKDAGNEQKSIAARTFLIVTIFHHVWHQIDNVRAYQFMNEVEWYLMLYFWIDINWFESKTLLKVDHIADKLIVGEFLSLHGRFEPYPRNEQEILIIRMFF